MEGSDDNKKMVSIIIPTYNRGKYIREAIQSVLNQTYQNFEIIVSDDGSTDNTKEVVESFNDRRIKYFWNKNSGLPAVARNIGIKKSSGKYIAFLDSDDLWLAKKLEKQINEFEKNENIGLVCSHRIYFDEKKEWIKKININDKDFTFKSLFIRNKVTCSTVIVKRSIFDNIGLFNECTKLQAGEDYEMWLRIANSYRIKYIQEPLVKYRHHSNVIRKNFVERVNMLLAIYESLLDSNIISNNLYELITEVLNFQKVSLMLVLKDKKINLKKIIDTKMEFWNKYFLMISFFIFRNRMPFPLYLEYYKRRVHKKLLNTYEKF